MRAGQGVHPVRQPGQRVVDQEVRALALHLPHQPMVAQQRLLEEAQELPVADAWVVLRAGDRELLCRDAPVQQVPGPRLFLLGHPLAEPVRVEAGHQRLRADAPARVVQPQRRLAGDRRQPVAVEMRERMRETGGVVPHFAGADELRAQSFGGVVHAAVGVGVRAVEHRRRHRSIRRPVAARLLVAPVDAAGRQHHDGRVDADLIAGGFIDRHRAGHAAIGGFQRGDAVTMQQRELASSAGIMQRGDHPPGQLTRGAPDDVVAGHRIAFAIASAFDPVHRRHEPDAVRQQPVVHVGARTLDVVARPLHGVRVLRVEFAEAHPVVQCDLGRVDDLAARLQRRTHQRHAAERP